MGKTTTGLRPAQRRVRGRYVRPLRLGVLAGLAAVAVAGVAAPSVAAATPMGEGPVLVHAHVESPVSPPVTGTVVTVEIDLVNTSTVTQRIHLDEVVSGMLDDARVTESADSSDRAISVTRIAHDRLALAGHLDPGATATLTYAVTIDDASRGGDGVLERVVVPADEEPSTCVGADPSSAEGIGVCTSLDVPSIRPAGTTATDEASTESERDVTVDQGVSSGALATSGVGGTTGDGPSSDMIWAAAIVGSALVAGALGAVVARSRRGRVTMHASMTVDRGIVPVRPRAARPPAEAVPPVSTSSSVDGLATVPTILTVHEKAASGRHGASGPIDSRTRLEPYFDSRRERRLVERRLEERGLALPVA